MNAQRLRNLTTGMLHTEMMHIYEDFEYLAGEKGIMTHQLPNAFRALQPWLKEKVTDQRFWDGKCDTKHQGEVDLQPMTADERALFWKRFGDQPSPFANLQEVTP